MNPGEDNDFLECGVFDSTMKTFKIINDLNLNSFLDKLKMQRISNKLSSKQLEEIKSLTSGCFCSPESI